MGVSTRFLLPFILLSSCIALSALVMGHADRKATFSSCAGAHVDAFCRA